MVVIHGIVKSIGTVIRLVATEIDLDSLFSDGGPANHGLWPIPPASAEKADEFNWPETESRPDGLDWPVFTGHTYGLGEDV